MNPTVKGLEGLPEALRAYARDTGRGVIIEADRMIGDLIGASKAAGKTKEELLARIDLLWDRVEIEYSVDPKQFKLKFQ